MRTDRLIVKGEQLRIHPMKEALISLVGPLLYTNVLSN